MPTSALQQQKNYVEDLKRKKFNFGLTVGDAFVRGIRDIEIEASRDLGATPFTSFTTVVIPRCRAGIVTAFSFAFLITVGDYITPMLVGGKQTLIGNLIAPQFGMQFNYPLGAAMSFVMLAISVAVIFVFGRLMAWWCRV